MNQFVQDHKTWRCQSQDSNPAPWHHNPSSFPNPNMPGNPLGVNAIHTPRVPKPLRASAHLGSWQRPSPKLSATSLRGSDAASPRARVQDSVTIGLSFSFHVLSTKKVTEVQRKDLSRATQMGGPGPGEVRVLQWRHGSPVWPYPSTPHSCLRKPV